MIRLSGHLSKYSFVCSVNLLTSLAVAHVRVRESINTCAKVKAHTKLGGEAKLTQLSSVSVSTLTCSFSPQAYWTISARVMGLASQDKRDLDEPKQTEQLSTDGRSPFTLKGKAATLLY